MYPIEQEEVGLHPWLVISEPRLARNDKLVIAVPMTSNPIEYLETQVQIKAHLIKVYPKTNAAKPLKKEQEGYIKCSKVRHWSVDRITVVGKAKLEFVNEVRGVVRDLFEGPVTRRKRRR